MSRSSRERLVIVSRSMPPDMGGYQRQFSLLAPHLAKDFDGVDWIGAIRDLPASRGAAVAGIRRMVAVPAFRLPRRIRGVADLVVVAAALTLLAFGRARGQRLRLLLLSPAMVGAPTLTRVASMIGARVIARYPTSGDMAVPRGRRVGMQRGVHAMAPSPLQVREQERFPVSLVVNAVEVPDDLIPGRRASDAGGRMLYVGRLVARKRVDVLVEAWKRARPDLRGWSLLVVGDGGSEHDSIEAEIRRMAESDGHRGVILQGRVPDARHLMADADVFVFPSEREGMPNSVLEALAAGLPVIAEARRAAEWFQHLPPLVDWDGTVEGLASRLCEVIEDDDLRRDLGRAGRAFAIEHHSPAAASAAIAALG